MEAFLQATDNTFCKSSYECLFTCGGLVSEMTMAIDVLHFWDMHFVFLQPWSHGSLWI